LPGFRAVAVTIIPLGVLGNGKGVDSEGKFEARGSSPGARLLSPVPEKLDPGDTNRGAPGDHVEQLERLLVAVSLDPFDQELKIGLERTEIDTLGISLRGMSGRHQHDPAFIIKQP
jgi:hypothetical protein